MTEDRVPTRTADDFLNEKYTYVEPRFANAFREGWNARGEQPAPPLCTCEVKDHWSDVHWRDCPKVRPAPPLDVERLIADMQALEPPASVRRETLRGWHDALAEASHLLRARLGFAPSRSES